MFLPSCHPAKRYFHVIRHNVYYYLYIKVLKDYKLNIGLAGWQFINLLIGLTKIGFLGKKPLVSRCKSLSFL